MPSSVMSSPFFTQAKKLGLADGPALDAAIQDVLAKYGSSNRNKYRAVVYYMLCVHFGKQAAYA